MERFCLFLLIKALASTYSDLLDREIHTLSRVCQQILWGYSVESV